jgi:hypothetical protein
MWNYSNDFDFYREWANVVVNGAFGAEIARPYNVLYASRRDGRPYVMSHDEVLAEFGSLIVHESRMERVLASAMGDHGYVMRSPDLEPLVLAAQRIQAVRTTE